MRKYIKEGEVMPKWYGYAYMDWAALEKVAYPLGINLFARWFHKIKVWICWNGFQKDVDGWRKMRIEEYNKGLLDGQFGIKSL